MGVIVSEGVDKILLFGNTLEEITTLLPITLPFPIIVFSPYTVAPEKTITSSSIRVKGLF